jgi:hypothetical protein
MECRKRRAEEEEFVNGSQHFPGQGYAGSELVPASSVGVLGFHMKREVVGCLLYSCNSSNGLF